MARLWLAGGHCRLADPDADLLPQVTQRPIKRCSFGAVLRIQHASHLVLGDIEVAGKRRCDMPAWRQASISAG